jgi:type II secretory pathway component PulL
LSKAALLIALIWGVTLTAAWSVLAADDAKAATQTETPESYLPDTKTT